MTLSVLTMTQILWSLREVNIWNSIFIWHSILPKAHHLTYHNIGFVLEVPIFIPPIYRNETETTNEELSVSQKPQSSSQATSPTPPATISTTSRPLVAPNLLTAQPITIRYWSIIINYLQTWLIRIKNYYL